MNKSTFWRIGIALSLLLISLALVSPFEDRNLGEYALSQVTSDANSSDHLGHETFSEVLDNIKNQLPAETEVDFTLDGKVLTDVQKAAAVISVPDMCLEAMSVGKAILKVTDKKNSTANDYAVGIDVTNADGKDVPYKFWFKVENLKLLPGSYDVNVSSKKISFFKNTKVDVEYFIALEPESVYDE